MSYGLVKTPVVHPDIYNSEEAFPSDWNQNVVGDTVDSTDYPQAGGGLYNAFTQGLKNTYLDENGGLNLGAIGSTINGLAQFGTGIMNTINALNFTKAYKNQQRINNNLMAANWNTKADQDFYNKENAVKTAMGLAGTNLDSEAKNTMMSNLDKSRIKHIDSNANFVG